MQRSPSSQIADLSAHLRKIGCGIVAEFFDALKGADKVYVYRSIQRVAAILFVPLDEDLVKIMAKYKLTKEYFLQLDLKTFLLNLFTAEVNYTAKASKLQMFGGAVFNRSQNKIDTLTIMETLQPYKLDHYAITVVLVYGILLAKDQSDQVVKMIPIQGSEMMDG